MYFILERCLRGRRGYRLSSVFKLLLGLGLVTFLFRISMATRKTSIRVYPMDNRGVLEEALLQPRTRDLQPIMSSSDTIDTVIDRAREIYKLGKPVLVNVFNNGFLNMTLNWLCHTEPMNIHQHVLLVTLDVNSTNTIRAAGFLQVVIVTLTDDLGSQVKGDTSYGKVGYHRLLYTRSRVLSSILKAGMEVIQFESDATWFVDPFPFTLHYAHLNQVPSDLVSLTCSDRPYLIATGYMYLRPSAPMVAIFTELDEALLEGVERHRNRSDRDKSIDKGLYDQPLLSKIYKSYKDRVVSRVVPWDIAPDGKWYDKPEVQNRTTPLMLSNNWTVGNYRKVSRAKIYGHWFLDDSAVCKRDMAKTFVEKNLQKCTDFCP